MDLHMINDEHTHTCTCTPAHPHSPTPAHPHSPTPAHPHSPTLAHAHLHAHIRAPAPAHPHTPKPQMPRLRGTQGSVSDLSAFGKLLRGADADCHVMVDATASDAPPAEYLNYAAQVTGCAYALITHHS
eukprot:355653-Chlamydomonas_euryale.AAC.3